MYYLLLYYIRRRLRGVDVGELRADDDQHVQRHTEYVHHLTSSS